MYRPPDSSKLLSKNFKNLFNDFIASTISEDKEFILLGDLNIDYKKESCHNDIKDIITGNGLHQVIKDFTRETDTSKTIIDIIITSHKNNIADTIVHITGISDHCLIGINRKINCSRYKPKIIRVRKYTSFNKEKFETDIQNIEWKSIDHYRNLNEKWNHFKPLLESCMNKYAPFINKKISGPSFT